MPFLHLYPFKIQQARQRQVLQRKLMERKIQQAGSREWSKNKDGDENRNESKSDRIEEMFGQVGPTQLNLSRLIKLS